MMAPVLFTVEGRMADIQGRLNKLERTVQQQAADFRTGIEKIEKRLLNLETLVQELPNSHASLGSSKAKLRNWIRANPLVAIISLVVTIFGVWLTYLQLHQPERQAEAEAVLSRAIDKEVDAKLSPHHLDELAADVHSMKGQMDEISKFLQTVATREMERASLLPLPEFEKDLLQIKSTISVAKLTGAQTTSTVNEGIQTRLVRTSHQQAEFWPTAAAFVSYRYASSRALPKCENTSPTRRLLAPLAPNQTGPVPVGGPVGLMDCVLDLSTVTQLNVPAPPGVPTVVLECTRCVVVYDGGDIPLFRAGFRSIIFRDCAFAVKATDTSPGAGKDLVASVLVAKNNQSIEYAPSTGQPGL